MADITPDFTVDLRGQMYRRTAEPPHEYGPITATVLALESESGDEQVIHVSWDLIGAGEAWVSGLRSRLDSRLEGFDMDNLIVSGTHTHTAPVESDGYNSFLADRVADAVVQAWENRSIGGVSWQEGHAEAGWCRIVVYDDGAAQMYGDPFRGDFSHMESEPDHRVPLLYTFDSEGALTGIVVNVSSPSQVVEGKEVISPDYWGEVRDQVAERIGPGLFVLALGGAAGDLSPRDLQDNTVSGDLKRDWPGLEYIGTRVADAVQSRVDSARNSIQTEIVLQHMVSIVELARKPEVGEGTVSIELHTYRIEEAVLATNPFELYVDYGFEIRERSPAQITFLSSYTSGSYGYLPTQEAVEATSPAYGATPSNGPVSPQGGVQLIEHTLQNLEEMFDDSIITPVSTENNSGTVNMILNNSDLFRIRYSVPFAMVVNMKIYSLCGRLVEKPVNGLMEAGTHTVSWNGTDAFGDQVPGGIYFLHVAFGEQHLVRRLTFLK
jgi:hypothetical protein